MKTGIKISTPSTRTIGEAIKNLVFFALTEPNVNIVFKPSNEETNDIVVTGNKLYKKNYLQNITNYLLTLDLFKNTPKIKLEIHNNIPFSLGYGAHVSCFATILKGLCAINKISLTNREVYNIIINDRPALLKKNDYGRLLTVLEGGCLFIDILNPTIFQRIFISNGLHWIVFSNKDGVETKSNFNNNVTENAIVKDLELILGLNSSNWDLIENSFSNNISILSTITSDQEIRTQIYNNILGVDFDNALGIFNFVCLNSLKADTVLKILEGIYKNKISREIYLKASPIQLTGSIKY